MFLSILSFENCEAHGFYGCASFSHDIILIYLWFKGDDDDALYMLDKIYLLSLDKGML
jgi:hypothetical protein